MNELRIGVVGYCPPTRFDNEMAREYIRIAYHTLEEEFPNARKKVVSGLINVGVLAIAYSEAVKRNWRTVGIACSKAQDYPCFPVDEKVIVGNEWGDESKTFLDSLDILIRVGGGKQAFVETDEFKRRGKRVLEYELEALK